MTHTAPESRGPRHDTRPAPVRSRALAFAALLLTCSAFAQAAAGEQPAALREWQGGHKPGFALTDTAGHKHSLADFGGRAVLVHFFATWCEPCRPEMQALERLVAREGDGAFRVVALSFNEPDGRVRRFFESTPVSFPVLLDRDRDVAKSWGVEILPTTYLLDADLVPRLFVDRDLEWDRLDIHKVLDAIRPTTIKSGGN